MKKTTGILILFFGLAIYNALYMLFIFVRISLGGFPNEPNRLISNIELLVSTSVFFFTVYYAKHYFNDLRLYYADDGNVVV